MMPDIIKPDLTGAEWGEMTVAERIAHCHAYARGDDLMESRREQRRKFFFVPPSHGLDLPL